MTTKYTEDHEYIRLQGDAGIVGTTPHAQDQLGGIVSVELPEIGVRLAKGDVAAVVESVKAASDIYSPVSGEIVEVNAALQNDPGLINTSPFESGWIFKLKISDPSQLEALKSPEAYREQIS